VILLHIKFHVPVSNGKLVNDTKSKPKHTRGRHVVVLHSTETLP